MNRIFRVEFKRGLYSIGFGFGIVILAAGGIIGAGDVREYMSQAEYLGEGLRFVEIVNRGMHSELFTFLLPIACTLPLSASCLEDQQSGTLYYILLRTTKCRYKWSKVLNCGLFGGMVVAAAVLVLVGLALVRYPVIGAVQELWKTIETSYYLGFLQKLLIFWLNGVLYALAGGMIALFVNNRYMAHAAPFIFYYVVSTLVDAYLSNIWIINPKEWMTVQLSSPSAVLTIMLALIVLMIIGYLKIIEIRGIHE